MREYDINSLDSDQKYWLILWLGLGILLASFVVGLVYQSNKYDTDMAIAGLQQCPNPMNTNTASSANVIWQKECSKIIIE